MNTLHPRSIGNAFALAFQADTRAENISRETAARVAERWQAERVTMPRAASADWQEGWDMACETIALALRFRT